MSPSTKWCVTLVTRRTPMKAPFFGTSICSTGTASVQEANDRYPGQSGDGAEDGGSRIAGHIGAGGKNQRADPGAGEDVDGDQRTAEPRSVGNQILQIGDRKADDRRRSDAGE